MKSGQLFKKSKVKNVGIGGFSKTPGYVDEDLLNQIEEVDFDDEDIPEDAETIDEKDLFRTAENIKKKGYLT